MSDKKEPQIPAPGPAHRRMDVFISKWHAEGKSYADEQRTDDPLASAVPWTSDESYEWLPGGFFILHRWDAMAGMRVFKGVEIIGYDVTEGGYFTRLFDNARRFRAGMAKAGFNLLAGEHPIIPVMLGEAKLAQDMAARLYEKGIYVTGFFFPVVPKGAARIRTQMSAAHSPADVDAAIAAFTEVGGELNII